MKNLLGAGIIGASLLTAPIVAVAQVRESPDFGSSAADGGRVLAMDIAGVRLRMTPTQARAALRASGYTPTPDRDMYADGRPKVERSHDYASRVRQERKTRLSDGSPTKSTETIVGEDWDKGDERVHVTYVPMRDGVEVSDVRYVIPEARSSWEGIRSSVIARYGRPTRVPEARHTVRYCGDGACAAVGANFAEMDLEGGWRLELSDGGALDRLSREQAGIDADRATAKIAKPSF